jgi:hypothetical protein
MSSLPRELTSIGTNNELSLLRAEPQSSRIYVTVHDPATVYTARLAAVPSSTDMVTAITYNTGSGTHTNILADQTIWVGSTSGAYDLGMVRIRNLTGIGATSGTFEIGEESEIAWASGAYLTVKDEFSIWAKHIRLVGTTPYLDYDLTYTDQNSLCDSIPVMGQHRVGWLDSATVTLAFDAGDSWVLNNSITGYVWAFPGAASTTGLTTATPTATYNATGVYRFSLAVTNDDSKVFVGYRYIFILQDETKYGALLPTAQALQDARIDSIGGDYNSGGWSAQVTLYDNADDSIIRDRALCIVHTRDTYGTYNNSAGFLAGSENVLMIGWIAGETIRRAPDNLYSSVTFTIEGPHYWLNRVPAFPVGLKDRTTTPTKWTRFLSLSAKAAVWHFLHWRTTITRCCDVFALENTYRAARVEAPGSQTLWEQLKSIEWTTVLAQPCADRYGRLFNQVEQQLLDTTTRAAVPECMTLEDQDISGDVEIERNIIDNASIIDLSGMAYDGSTGTPFFSLSPGRVFRRYGAAPEVVDQLVLYDQATTNTLCGWYAGWKNNEYPRVSMTLGSANRFVDIAPWQYWLYNLTADDSPRGIAKSFRLIPRRVAYQWQNTAGYLLTQAEFEAENIAELSITGDAPEEIPVAPPIAPPPPPIVNPIPLLDQPIAGAVMRVTSALTGNPTTYGIVYSGDISLTDQPTWTTLAMPSGWTGDIPVAGTFDSHLYVSPNGSRLILSGAISTTSYIWECTNWASIWNNPTPPAPVWVVRVQFATTTIGGLTITRVSSLTAGQGAFSDLSGTLFQFTCKVNNVYSIATIAADGTLAYDAKTSTNSNHGMSFNYYNDVSLTSGNSYLRSIASESSLFTWNDSVFGTQEICSPTYGMTGYVRDDTTDYDAIISANGTYDVIAHVSNSYLILSGRSFVMTCSNSQNGDVIISRDNGATWSAFATWLHGRLQALSLEHDSGWLWAAYTTVANGSVPLRLYDSAGTPTLDITGNWWTDIFASRTSTTVISCKAWYSV